MKGYDEYNTVLLPPRDPGVKLPGELTDYYEEQMKKLEEVEKARREEQEAAEQRQQEQALAEGRYRVERYGVGRGGLKVQGR